MIVRREDPRRPSGARRAPPAPPLAHPWRFAVLLSALFTALISPFALWATGLDAFIGLFFIFVFGIVLGGVLLVAANPLRIGRFGTALRRRRHPWQAAAGAAVSVAAHYVIRLADPGENPAQVLATSALVGLGAFILFGLLFKFVGDPPPRAAEQRPSHPWSDWWKT
jgi:peptidoglycan/LPS O-acetylase OafA/YrhL